MNRLCAHPLFGEWWVLVGYRWWLRTGPEPVDPGFEPGKVIPRVREAYFAFWPRQSRTLPAAVGKDGGREGMEAAKPPQFGRSGPHCGSHRRLIRRRLRGPVQLKARVARGELVKSACASGLSRWCWRQTGGGALLGLKPSSALGLDGAGVAGRDLKSEVESHGCLRVRVQVVRQAL